MRGVPGDDLAFGQIPPLHLLVAESGVGRVDQGRFSELPVPPLPARIPRVGQDRATVRSVHAVPVRRGFRPGSAADGHGIPASFSAQAMRAALCLASRCANIHRTTGYHRGTRDLGPAERLLAAADVVAAMGEQRPHRPAARPAQISATIRAEVGAGRLDRTAADAVLAAVVSHNRLGQRSSRSRNVTSGHIVITSNNYRSMLLCLVKEFVWHFPGLISGVLRDGERGTLLGCGHDREGPLG
jgi:hypothetical protein